MQVRAIARVISIITLVFLADTVCAHHSPAAFDTSRTLVLSGTVKEFRWGNPHTWLYLLVPNNSGGVDEWEIEGTSLVVLARSGWKASSLQAGEKVEVTLSPLRNGTNGGVFSQVKRATGEVLRVSMGPPPGSP